jgi:hypothetical protein
MSIKNTLLNYYKTPFIPLEKIAEELVGCSKAHAEKLALGEELPFITLQFDFHYEDNAESPYLVNIDDLVQFIESERSAAQSMRFQYKRLASETPI